MVDIIIIGAGPAGLSAAINAKQMGKSVIVVDNKSTYLSKAEKVNNYLGFYNVDGEFMMNAFRQHAQNMGIDITHGKTLKILPNSDSFLVNIGTDVCESRAIILALGVCNKGEIRGEREFLGQGVSYCAVCDGMLYRGKKVIVYGTSKHSIEGANYLSDINVEVIFVSTANMLEGLKKNIENIRATIVEILPNGVNKKVVLKKVQNSERIDVDVSAVFILRDSVAPEALLDNIETVNGYIKVDRNMETNIKNIYAAGDCTGKPLQIAKAVGEGLIAAQSACNRLS